MIGFIVMRFTADPAMAGSPITARVRDDETVTVSTAILLCVRNELPARIIRNLEPMLAGIVASGYGERFHLYVLSDTNGADLALKEETHFFDLARRWRDRVAITYRRRTINSGYKAGNIREFCERWGGRHEFAVTLDADSFMTADAMLRLVRIMQADPRLGILQGLVVGLPSTSLFVASSSSGCGSACVVTPSAVHGGNPIADLTGAITQSCASRPLLDIASFLF